jgi:type I restriction enzyme R subunit
MEYEDGIVEPILVLSYASPSWYGQVSSIILEDLDYPVKQSLLNLSGTVKCTIKR